MHKTKIEILGIHYYLGLGFLNRMIEGTGRQLEELAVLHNVALIPKLVYYSRLYACEMLGIEVDFNQDTIYEYIDDNGGIDGAFIAEFYPAYLKAMKQGVPVDEEPKKKALKK